MEMNFNLCIGNLAKFALLGTVLSWDAARRDSAFLRTAVGRRTPGSGMFQGSCGTPHAGIRHVLGQFGDAGGRGGTILQTGLSTLNAHSTALLED